MFIFDFRNENDIIVYESDDKLGVKDYYERMSHILLIYLKPNEKKKSFIKTGCEEGEIYKRVFYLNDYDLDRANNIIDNYKKERYLKYEKQFECIKELNH